MVIVYVWNYRGKSIAWGHASLKIEGGPTGPAYISYWPQGDGRESAWYSQQVYCVAPIPNRTFAADVRDEAGPPDYTIRIEGLNEDAMRAWWAGVNADVNAKWCTLSRNCSTTVAQALFAGGGDDLAGSWWHSHNVVWKPDDILRYAMAIQKGATEKAKK